VVSVTKENYTYASKLISTKGKTKASASVSTATTANSSTNTNTSSNTSTNAKSSTNPITSTSANNNTKTNENTNNKTKTSSKINRTHKELVQKLDVRLEQLVVGEPYRLDNINFATNSSSVLTVASMVTLDGFAKYLISVPEMIVAIQGHTDNVGSDNDNQELSHNRAKSVFDYLVLSGVRQNRLLSKGFGETKPIASNSTEEGKAKNRRTEFVVESF